MPDNIQFISVSGDGDRGRIYDLRLWQYLVSEHIRKSPRSGMNIAEGLDFWAKPNPAGGYLASNVAIDQNTMLRTPDWATHVFYATNSALRLIQSLTTNQERS